MTAIHAFDGTDDERFDALLERSSLGTSGARQLRQRTPLAVAETIRRMSAPERRKEEPPPPARAPVPQLLAVIPSGASVEETIARLTAIQAEHPGAKVRHGKRNSREIWAAPASDQPANEG